MPRTYSWLAGVLFCVPLAAQQTASPDLREILERLAKLEQQNKELTEQVRSLQQQLGMPANPQEGLAASPLAERMDVTEQRLAEVEQTHVATNNKLPVTLTGMLLFNSYLNGQGASGAQYPTLVPQTGRASSGGATFRQSVIGLRAEGPTILGGGKVKGSIFLDFFSGNAGLSQTMRVRTAGVTIDWKKTSFGVLFDKPLIAQRDPDSVAQVGVSPLTSAGNLWLWQPQVRLERRTAFGSAAGLRAQFSVYQTSEGGAGVASAYADTLASSRPGYEMRYEFWKTSGNRRIEIAPGYHASSTRVVGKSAPSRIGTVDWLIRPVSRIELTGTYFIGQNTGVIGGLRQGVTVLNGPTPGSYNVRAVRSQGGWAQVKLIASQRTSIHFFGGQQDDRNRDLLRDAVLKNQAYGANVLHRWGSNFITGFEASQVRTTYTSGTRLNPHYDLTFAYLF